MSKLYREDAIRLAFYEGFEKGFQHGSDGTRVPPGELETLIDELIRSQGLDQNKPRYYATKKGRFRR